MYLYRMKVRRIEAKRKYHGAYQRFQTVNRYYNTDEEAMAGFARFIVQLNDPESDHTSSLLALPMWIKRQSIGGTNWVDIIKKIPKHPYANG